MYIVSQIVKKKTCTKNNTNKYLRIMCSNHIIIHAFDNNEQLECFLRYYNWTRKVTCSKWRDSGGCWWNSAFTYTSATYSIETVTKPLNNFPHGNLRLLVDCYSKFPYNVSRERLHLRQRRMHAKDWENFTQLL